MQADLLARAPVLLLALLMGGCASVPSITKPLVATPMLGPYPMRDDACGILVQSATREGWKGSTCDVTPIPVGDGAPLTAAMFQVKKGGTTDPRLAGTGAYFLGVSVDVVWFLTERSLDEVNGAAGHTYLPTVSAEKVTVVPRQGSDARMLFELRDATESVCNVCEGAEHDKRTPVKTNRIIMVCGRLGSGKPECTAPLTVSTGAKVSLEDDILSVSEPGQVRVRYAISL